MPVCHCGVSAMHRSWFGLLITSLLFVNRCGVHTAV